MREGSVPLCRATCGVGVIKSTGGCAGLPWGAGRGAAGRQVPCTWGHTARPSGKPRCWRCPRPSEGVGECLCSPQGWLGDFLPSTSLFWAGGFGVGSVVQRLCLEEGAGLPAAVSPPVSPETPQGCEDTLGRRGGRGAVLVGLCWRCGAGRLPSPSEPPRWCKSPVLSRSPSRDSTGGARWAARPLSQPRDTDLIHYRRPPPLCRGLPASLLARAEGRRRDGRGHGEHRGLYLLFALGNPTG